MGVFRVAAVDDVEERALDLLGDRPARAAADLDAVELADRRHLGGRAGEGVGASPGDIRALCQFGPIYQSEVQLERERYALSAGVKLGAVVGILGEVFVRHHKGDTHVATRNEVLYDGTRVITKESSCATLHINLGGDIVMREDSIVVIHSQEWAKTKINWVDTCLESGALRSRLGELAGHGGGSL